MTLLTAAEQRRHSAIRRVVVAVGALVVVAAASVAVTLLVVEGGEPQPRHTTPGASPPPSEPTSKDADAGTWQLRPVSAGPLILPPPSGSEQGIPTGFPHTTEGAISAAARYNETVIGLDFQVARQLGEVAAAPSYRSAITDLVQGVTVARQSLGLRSDEVPAGAYLDFRSEAYRVLDATPDRVVVAVLGQVEGAGPATGGQGRTAISVAAYAMVWADGDWCIAGDAATQALQPLPEPRTPHAYEERWRDLALA